MRSLSDRLAVPPRAFSPLPFWFWNDDLSEQELVRQVADFDAHGIFGFVIHPRVGLPREIGWMSDRYLHFCAIAVEEAKRRAMKVILYDEGMYPSGSSCGQVVAADPSLACRGLSLVVPDVELAPGQTLVAHVTTAGGAPMRVIDRPIDAYIRGLHFLNEGEPGKLREDEPPAGDILNPKTVELILKQVHERYYAALGDHFGDTIIGMFTDEPSATGKCREKGIRAGTTGVLPHVNRLLGDDFSPHLPALWLDDEPDAARHRKRWNDAISLRLEETWFGPLADWCNSHGVALCGHPEKGDQLGVQRFFGMPGQDIVWRFIEREKPSAVEGPESTQGKVTSSAMIHLGRERNSNEFCGAYGHETTFEEMRWLADWLLVRGVNLLVPHAFYYSIRGPRVDERPPQLGPWTPAWDDGRFKAWADHATRLCWLNGDGSRHVADIAILTDPEHAAWAAAKVCFEHQHDFNYLDPRTLIERATVVDRALKIADMAYRLIVIDGLDALPAEVEAKLKLMIDAGRVVRFADAAALLSAISRCCASEVELSPPSSAVRIRHVAKGDDHFYLFFNERGTAVAANLTVAATGRRSWIDTTTGESVAAAEPLTLELEPYSTALIHVEV